MGHLEVNNKLSHVVISEGLYTLPLQRDGMCTNALCKFSCICSASKSVFLLLAAGVARTIYRVSQEECARLGRVFLMLKYTDITQNTYVQS